jgi:hypothetical protein
MESRLSHRRRARRPPPDLPQSTTLDNSSIMSDATPTADCSSWRAARRGPARPSRCRRSPVAARRSPRRPSPPLGGPGASGAPVCGPSYGSAGRTGCSGTRRRSARRYSNCNRCRVTPGRLSSWCTQAMSGRAGARRPRRPPAGTAEQRGFKLGVVPVGRQGANSGWPAEPGGSTPTPCPAPRHRPPGNGPVGQALLVL